MVTTYEIDRQLREIGIGRLPLCGSEIRQLPNTLVPGEKIEFLLAGRYLAGYAIMVATNHRLLVIDKTIGGLVIEDIPYDMIAEVEYVQHALGAKIVIFARAKKIEFRAIRGTVVREFTQFLEGRIMEIRNQLRTSAANAGSGYSEQGNYYGNQNYNQRRI